MGLAAHSVDDVPSNASQHASSSHVLTYEYTYLINPPPFPSFCCPTSSDRYQQAIAVGVVRRSTATVRDALARVE